MSYLRFKKPQSGKNKCRKTALFCSEINIRNHYIHDNNSSSRYILSILCKNWKTLTNNKSLICIDKFERKLLEEIIDFRIKDKGSKDGIGLLCWMVAVPKYVT